MPTRAPFFSVRLYYTIKFEGSQYFTIKNDGFYYLHNFHTIIFDGMNKREVQT